MGVHIGDDFVFTFPSFFQAAGDEAFSRARRIYETAFLPVRILQGKRTNLINANRFADNFGVFGGRRRAFFYLSIKIERADAENINPLIRDK